MRSPSTYAVFGALAHAVAFGCSVTHDTNALSSQPDSGATGQGGSGVDSGPDCGAPGQTCCGLGCDPGATCNGNSMCVT
nr:hypothetical protein [Polyangiaceae bacterium]